MHIMPIAVPVRNELMPLSDCICQNYSLTLTCTVVGGGATVWKGSAFRTCPFQEILLVHLFGENSSITKQCNDGLTEFNAYPVINEQQMQFTTALNISSFPLSLNGTNVECVHDDGMRNYTIGTRRLLLTGTS